MHTQRIHWHTSMETPAAESVVLFDDGLETTMGKFRDGHFETSRQAWVDPLLVNRWRYCEIDERAY